MNWSRRSEICNDAGKLEIGWINLDQTIPASNKLVVANVKPHD